VRQDLETNLAYAATFKQHDLWDLNLVPYDFISTTWASK